MEGSLKQRSATLCSKEALDRIRTVIGQVLDAPFGLEQEGRFGVHTNRFVDQPDTCEGQ